MISRAVADVVVAGRSIIGAYLDSIKQPPGNRLADVLHAAETDVGGLPPGRHRGEVPEDLVRQVHILLKGTAANRIPRLVPRGRRLQAGKPGQRGVAGFPQIVDELPNIPYHLEY